MRIRAILLAVATATALSLLPSSSGAAEAAVYTASGHISVTPKSIENPGSFEVKAVVAKASSITTSPFLPKQAKIVANGVLTLAPPPLTHQNSPIVGTGIFTLTSSDGHTSRGSVALFLLPKVGKLLMRATSGDHKGSAAVLLFLYTANDTINGRLAWLATH